MGFPDSSVGKESTCNAGDPSSIPGSGRSPGEGIGYSLQHFGLENSTDRSPWGHKELDTTERVSLHFNASHQEVQFISKSHTFNINLDHSVKGQFLHCEVIISCFVINR